MESTTSFLIVALGYLAFGIATVIWITKKKKAGEKISLLAKIIIAMVVLSSSSALLSVIIEPSPEQETNAPETSTLYVKEGGANVRECPSTSCKVISTLPQNAWFTFSGDSYDKYPNWAEVTLLDGRGGYVSKSTLSFEVSEVPQPQENGIRLAKWNFDPLEIDGSYGISFCIPDSARSGATCGGLAGDTQTPIGGSPPYSFVKSSGFLPPGMSLELNGLLSGSPTTEGTYNFKLCAKDLSMNQGCENYTLVVKKEDSIAQPSSGGNYKAVLSFTADMQNYQRNNDSLLANNEHVSVTVTASRSEQDEQGSKSISSYNFSSTGRSSIYVSSNCISQYSGTFGDNLDSGPGAIYGYLPSRPLIFKARTGYAGDYRDFDYTPLSADFCATWPPDVFIREVLSDIISGTGGGIALDQRSLNPAGETISFSNDYRPEHLATDRITYNGTLVFTKE